MSDGARGVAFSVFVISFATLALELLLLRILSLRWSHHFASLVIGIGLLGFGASGTLLALFQRGLHERPRRWLAAFALAFSWAAALAPLALAYIPFEPYRLPIDLQLLPLATELSLAVLPFLAAGLFTGLALAAAGSAAPRIYAASLFGAGAGPVAAVLLLHAAKPEMLTVIFAFAGVVAALPFLVRSGAAGVAALLGGALGPLAAASIFFGAGWDVPLSEYKALSRVHGFPDAKTIHHASGPLGRVDVVQSRAEHYAAGLSMNYQGDLPEQRGLFLDGGSLGAITRLEGDPAELSYIRALLFALPYELRRGGRALAIGAGGGLELLIARAHGLSIDGIEMNPEIVDLMMGPLAEFSGRIYTRPGVRVFRTEARGHLARQTDRYDLIVLPALDAFGTLAVTGAAPGETPLYTVEAVGECLAHLEPEGVLSLGRWLRNVPREEIRLIATAIRALELLGTDAPGDHLLIARDWESLLVLVKRAPWHGKEIAAARSFLKERSFDFVHAPGVSSAETNRFHILTPDLYREATEALLGPDRAAYLAAYPFDIAPVTDDRPFFFHTLKRGSLEVLRERSAGQLVPIDDWAERLLIASALVAAALALVFFAGPFALAAASARRRGETQAWAGAGARPVRIALFFAALGAGYIAIEIALLGRFIQFLAQPIGAAAGVLAILLGGSGAGSYLAGRLALGRKALRAVLAGIVVYWVLAALLLPRILEPLRAWPDAWRWVAVAAFLLPLAMLMGCPFPLALARLAGEARSVVPLAWGANGFASVISASLAQYVAIERGYTAVTLAAAGIYLCAAAAAAGITQQAPAPARGAPYVGGTERATSP
ncbi:MAG: hypothetical protein L0Z55_03470 [Planctomycetes bacterium]|nr:hypothetical protein [Planctomycetota bacterium]